MRNDLFVLLISEVLFLWLLFESSNSTSVMVDEFAHIPAGVSYWETGRFTLYRENPPLIRLLFSLPCWLSGARVDYSRAAVGYRSEWRVGADFGRFNQSSYARFLWQARLVVATLAVACGALIFWWARELYGGPPAAVVALLWFSDPNVLAHSSMASTDVGTAFAGLFAAYSYWLFLRNPDLGWALLAGIGIGLAQVSKFSMLILYPALLAVTLVTYCQIKNGRLERITKRAPVKYFFLVVVVSFIVINFVYSFEGTFRCLGSYNFRSPLLSGVATGGQTSPPTPRNVFRHTLLGGIPVPLPSNYVLGIDSEMWDVGMGHVRLEGGQLARGGHWYSPFQVLALKMPLGSLLLVLASISYNMYYPRREQGGVKGILLFPTAGLFALLCLHPGLNWLIRYLLPAIPFALIATGALIRAAWTRTIWRTLVILCLAWNGWSLLSIRPFYLSFGNEIAGGPEGAQKVFLGSNFDWGQDLFNLKRFADANPNYRPLIVTYFGVLTPEAIALESQGLPASFLTNEASPSSEDENEASSDSANNNVPDMGFYWAISSNILNGLTTAPLLMNGETVMAVIQSPLLKPQNAFARVGHSIYVFHVTTQDQPLITPSLNLRDLRSCLRVYEPGDITNAP